MKIQSSVSLSTKEDQTRLDNFSGVIKSPEVPGSQIDVKKMWFTPFTKLKPVAAFQEPDENHVLFFFPCLFYLKCIYVNIFRTLFHTLNHFSRIHFQSRLSGWWLSFHAWVNYFLNTINRLLYQLFFSPLFCHNTLCFFLLWKDTSQKMNSWIKMNDHPSVLLRWNHNLSLMCFIWNIQISTVSY